MKTILWAALTANGNYAQSSPEHPPKMEALGDFTAQAKAAGNFIVGRRTFEGMLASGGNPFGEMDVVVISKQAADIPGAKVAESPQAALGYLRERGHDTALLAGGAELHNAFLEQDLVDEAIFVIAPVLEGKGLNLVLDTNNYRYKDVELLDFKALGGGVVQLRYSFGRSL